LTDLIIGY